MLVKEFKAINDEVKKSNPLARREGGKKGALEGCMEDLRDQVQKWQYVDPDDEKCTRRLHHRTQLAIIKVNGGKFISRGGGKKRIFNWMEDQ